MTEKYKLKAKTRQVTGKQVKKLRQAGLIPAHVYGSETESINLSLDEKEFKQIFKQAGETRVIELQIESESASRSVMITGIQEDPLRGDILHIDLYQVVLTEKVEVEVPITINDRECPAVRDHLGVLINQINEITIKALPGDVPEEIIADLSGLTAVGQSLQVKDLSIPANVQLVTEPEQIVATVEPLVGVEVEDEAVKEVEAEPEVEKKPGGEETEAESS